MRVGGGDELSSNGIRPLRAHTDARSPFDRPERDGAETSRRPSASAAVVAAEDEALFQRLRAVRRALADAENVPAYIVFSDAVLARMAAARPSDEAGLLAIAGVGPAKLARYGEAFLRALHDG